MLHVQGVWSPPGLRGGPTAECLPGTEGTGSSYFCPQMIREVDLIHVDVLSRSFRNSSSGGTAQAAGTVALASLGR
jgi:hypothetical protein